jgi:hypothetical protein
MFRFAQHDKQGVGRFNPSTTQRFNDSTVEKDVLGHRIQHRAAADGFAKCFAEMTQA